MLKKSYVVIVFKVMKNPKIMIACMISHVHVSQCCKINIDSGRSLTVIVSAPPLFFCVNKLLMSD